MIDGVAYDMDQISPEACPSFGGQAYAVGLDLQFKLPFAQSAGQGGGVSTQTRKG